MQRLRSVGSMLRDRAVYLAGAGLILGAVVTPILPASTAVAAPKELTNPSLEMLTAGVPDCFIRGGWGQHTAAWQLVAGRTGAVAQSLTLSNYVSGDRKLMVTESAACAPAVTPGQKYNLAVWYKATTAKNSLTVFRHSAAGWTYWTDLKQLPATEAWAEAAATTPEIPEGTDQISFGISLSANGTLITDDYGFAPVEQPAQPQPTAELTTNGGLEAGGALPTGWMRAGWGDATVTGGVTAAAHSGTRAYSLTLANRTTGDYKLLPTEATAPAVQPGGIYNLSVWYQSTSKDNSLTIFAHTASGWGYWTDVQTLPAVAAWTQVKAQTPPIPAGIDAIAWGVSISSNGTLVTDDYSTTKQGDALPPAEGVATKGEWSVLDYQMPLRAVHSTVLKNGRVLLIAGSGNSVEEFRAGSFKASVWDPVAGTFTALAVPKDMFCAGHATLADGRVLIQGGTKNYPTTAEGADYGGLKDSWIFNPDTNQFTATNNANEGHWYPTLTQLGNGDVWMAGGLKEDTTGAVNTERFSAATGQWLPTGQVKQTWSFWGLYPHMFLMADGRLFYSGAHTFGNGLPGTGASIYNADTGAIADVPGLRQKDMRDQASSVLLPPAQDQKVLITGGGNINTGNPAIGLTDIIDLNQAVPAYQPGPDLPGEGKMYVNATILPDRTVLFSNGGKLNRDAATNVMSAAIYDPATNTMKPVAADPIGRNYHSSAVLLPDGRVVVFGSNPGDGSFELRISTYKPGYFFLTERPEMTNVPAQLTYGQTAKFQVNAPNKIIRSAQLTKPMSVTHQTDSNLRLVDLPVVVQNGVATVNVPANRNLLPPGPYMLTVTDSDGVPSTAAWVMVR
ncbi:MAG TPA: galactose oxidase early set domain-containing protein [Candidatus Saccharimonadales bacterium]|nr:galactose oxidase early set domain-containing protein [Candidatus Saccharimonadales bacterium]